MSSDSETVAEIVSDMYAYDSGEIADIWVHLFAERIEAAAKREVEELRECLNEAIREKCPFTQMSCKHGEPCEYACGTDKWRKAIDTTKGGAE